MPRSLLRALLSPRRTVVGLVIVLAATLPVAAGQVSSAPPSPAPTRTPQPLGTPKSTSPLTQPGQQVTLSGRLSVLYGDPIPGRSAAGTNQQGTTRYYVALPGRPPQLVELTTDAQSVLPKDGLFSLAGRNINLRGITIAPRVSRGAPRVTVRTVAASTSSPTSSAYASADVPDDTPVTTKWLVVGCKYADVATETDAPSYFSELVSETYPFLGDYWERVSYRQIMLTGSVGADGWYTMPGNRSDYRDTGGNAETTKLYDDCVTGGITSTDVHNQITVDGQRVEISGYYGVIMLFNDTMDSCPPPPATGPCYNYGVQANSTQARAWIMPGTDSAHS